MLLIHSRLYDSQGECVNQQIVKVALLGCHSACFVAQYINYCVVTAQLLDCKSGAMRAFCVFDWLTRMAFMLGKTIKTAF